MINKPAFMQLSFHFICERFEEKEMTTYSQFYVQIVFAVKYRQNLISQEWEEKLHKYITGIISNNDQKVLAINGIANHIHIFIGCKASVNIPNLVRDVKRFSTIYVNENKLCSKKFEWQNGYGAFSYRRSDIPQICNYIANQKKHHNVETYEIEYMKILKEYYIDYDPKYIFAD